LARFVLKSAVLDLNFDRVNLRASVFVA
jgi:hypothetical protein